MGWDASDSCWTEVPCPVDSTVPIWMWSCCAPLWGKRATVQGVVHFKSNGLPRLIEARRISAHAEGDMIFETMPEAEAGVGKPADAQSGRERPTAVSGAVGKAMRRVDPMILWGTWPGDEPIEELLAQLD